MSDPFNIIPSQIVLGILIATSSSLIGLLAIWAAWSPRHWFLRTAAIMGVLLLAVLIPAYEPMLAFLIQAIVVTGALAVVKLRRARTEEYLGEQLGADGTVHPIGPRFSLATLLLLVAIAAVAFAVGARIPAEVWAAWLPIACIGICLGSITLLATWAVQSRRRWWIRAVVLFVIVAIVGFPQALAIAALPNLDALTFLWIVDRIVVNTLRRSLLEWELVVFWLTVVWAVLHAWMVALLVSLWLILGTTRQRYMTREGKDEPSHIPSRWATPAGIALALVSLAILLPPATTYWRCLNPAPKPHVVLPSPNAYYDLVQAGGALSTNVINNYETAGQAALRSEITKHTATLAQTRTALDRGFRWPLTYTSEDIPFARDNEGMRQMRIIARAFAAEARLAKMEGRFDDASRSHADTLRLGHAIPHHGIFIHYVLGQALYGKGAYALVGVREQITPDQAKDLIARLEELSAPWEPVDDAMARDRTWTEHAYGWQGRLFVAIDEITGGSLYAADVIRASYNRHDTRVQLLIADLAVRSYRREHGDLPEALSVLVPDYITAVPNDPNSDGRLIYRVTDDGYLLYSIGPDGKDDGGRPMADPYSDGDFVVDTRYDRLPPTTAQTRPAEEDADDAGEK